MTNQGYIKISRKLLSWRWYNHINTRLVFLDLLMKAAWCDEFYLGVPIRRGQVAVTLTQLATDNQLTVQQTRTTLEKLKSTGDITIDSNTKFSIITLNFYEEIQGNNTPDNTQTTNASPENQQTPSSKNNTPTYYNNKKIIKETRITPAARVGRNNNYKSSTSSFDIDEIMARINKG